MKAGFISHVLTTNIDSLLEQALESVDLVRDADFDVVLLGTPTSREALDSLDEDEGRPLILKLHGDISRGEFGVTSDEIEHAVHSAKRFIKDELESDLVIVGYEGEAWPLNDWLGRSHSQVWWAHDVPPQEVVRSPEFTWLRLGPADLFSALATRLLTLRNQRPGGNAEPEVMVRSPPAAAALPLPTPPGEHELLLHEIERLKTEAAAEHLAAGTVLQRQEQIAQRRQRIRELEDQLRALPAARERILQLLDRVQQSVLEAEGQADASLRVDPATSHYLTAQVDALREQYQGEQPNSHVVSAALGAAIVVAERLGPSVIDPQDVQALAAFGPTMAGRR